MLQQRQQKLTSYEMDRKPQKITMDSDIAVSPRSLHRELMCPICLDILNQTMTTRECLHRFCSACINKALRSGNKECPTCRKKLTSRRCLRADPNFDQLIAKIYRGEHDRPQESSKVIIAPECELILRPLNGQKTRVVKGPHHTTIDHISKYLSMKSEWSKPPELGKEENYKLCVLVNQAKGHYEMIPGHLNLEDVKKKYKLEASKPLELYFHIPNKD